MKKSIKKPIDDFIRDYVRRIDPFNQYSRRELDRMNDKLADQMYVFDCPITSVEIYPDDWGGQGCSAVLAEFFCGKEKIYTVKQKEYAISLRLYISDTVGGKVGFNYCADPRIVATVVLAADLDILGCNGGINYETRQKEISAALSPIMSRETAIEWLERNYFIGEKALSKRAIACRDHLKTSDKEKKYPECWLNEGYPGWAIASYKRELAYVPPQAREVYDKYYSAWKEAKRRQEQKEKEERRKEEKRKLEEEKRRLEEAKRKLEEEKQRLEAEKRKLEEEKRRLEAAKQKKAPSKHAPKAPPTLKEVKRNWNEIIKTYEQIEKKKKAK